MKRIHFQLFVMAFTVSLVSMSCRKNQDKNDAAEIAQQSSLAQKSMTNLGVMSSEAINEAFTSFAGTCSTITYDTAGVAKTITIDYGTAGCECADGKSRKGKVMIATSGIFNGIGEANKYVTTTSGYYVNDNLVEGTLTTTKTSGTETNMVSACTITLPADNGSFTWNGDFKSEFLSGDNTPYAADDEYNVTGSANGVNTKEVAYTTTVTGDLLVQTGCRWVKSGIMTISADNMKDDATLNYGDGSCDNYATLEYKDKEQRLTL